MTWPDGVPGVLGPILGLTKVVGNTRHVLAANGGVLSSAAYSAWGSSFGGTVSTPLGWNGRFGVYRDPETGLLLMGARYYAPSLGRFTQRDPIGFDGDINLYGYCGGDPVNLDDATGLQVSDDDPDADVMRYMRFVDRRKRRFLKDSFGWKNENWKYLQQDTRQNLGERYVINTPVSPIPVLLEVQKQAHLSAVLSAARPLQAAASVNSAKLCTDTARARELGKVGEALAGIAKNTERIKSLSGTATYRVPDILNHDLRIIGDVKNVAYQPFSRQIKDYLAYAQLKGYTFKLYVRPTAKLSPLLQREIDAGKIELIRGFR